MFCIDNSLCFDKKWTESEKTEIYFLPKFSKFQRIFQNLHLNWQNFAKVQICIVLFNFWVPYPVWPGQCVYTLHTRVQIYKEILPSTTQSEQYKYTTFALRRNLQNCWSDFADDFLLFLYLPRYTVQTHAGVLLLPFSSIYYVTFNTNTQLRFDSIYFKKKTCQFLVKDWVQFPNNKKGTRKLFQLFIFILTRSRHGNNLHGIIM